jgi:hypothetical protein
MLVYIGLTVWLLRYASSMFSISEKAYLGMDISSIESVENMYEFSKINISNFAFIAATLVCKILSSLLMLIRMMDLLDNQGSG